MGNTEMLSEISRMIETHMDNTKRLLEEQTLLINLKIENDVTKRMESLFDGYRLTHERQQELLKEIDSLEKRVQQLEASAC